MLVKPAAAATSASVQSVRASRSVARAVRTRQISAETVRPTSSRNRGCLAWFVYILRCSDSSYYVGHTEDVPARVKRHQNGTGAIWTAARRSVSLVFEEQHPSEAAAVARERQIKRWSRQKKEGLIAGTLTALKTLSRCRGVHGRPEV